MAVCCCVVLSTTRGVRGYIYSFVCMYTLRYTVRFNVNVSNLQYRLCDDKIAKSNMQDCGNGYIHLFYMEVHRKKGRTDIQRKVAYHDSCHDSMCILCIQCTQHSRSHSTSLLLVTELFKSSISFIAVSPSLGSSEQRRISGHGQVDA